MAGEIQRAHSATAATLYALVRNNVGQIWNGSAFVSYVTANLGTYAVTMTEQGAASQFYAGTFPATSAGIYTVSVFVRAGGSPAEGDVCAETVRISWDGAALTGATLSATERNAAATAMLDLTAGVETSWTLRQALRGFLGMLVGKSSGCGGPNPTYRNPGDNKDRVIFTADASGNRTATTYDMT